MNDNVSVCTRDPFNSIVWPVNQIIWLNCAPIVYTSFHNELSKAGCLKVAWRAMHRKIELTSSRSCRVNPEWNLLELWFHFFFFLDMTFQNSMKSKRDECFTGSVYIKSLQWNFAHREYQTGYSIFHFPFILLVNMPCILLMVFPQLAFRMYGISSSCYISITLHFSGYIYK